MTPLASIEHLLRESMGLDAQSIGSSAIARAVQQRLLACQLPDGHAYLERLRTSESELQALIETVVVSETWYFREPHAFTAMARAAIEEWLPAHPARTLRLLSLPSSTGEEPYSMAMALLDAGFPAHRFRIDAIDISEHALAQARCGVYGKNSFRSGDLAFRDRHFERADGEYRISEAIRRQVTFQQGNLVAAGFLPGTDLYDVVFCRNVLIYFDRPTQEVALGVLRRLLTADGVLFVAPSETGVLLNRGFVSTRVPLAFGFRKAGSIQCAPQPVRRQPGQLRAAGAPIRPQTVVPSVASAREIPPVASLAPSAPFAAVRDKSALDAANNLANEGHFSEAARQCEEHLRQHGPSALAFYLLGLVNDACGNVSEAGNCYRKAIYLDPHHQESLIHLALLMEQQGRTADAQRLHGRARRVGQRATT